MEEQSVDSSALLRRGRKAIMGTSTWDKLGRKREGLKVLQNQVWGKKRRCTEDSPHQLLHIPYLLPLSLSIWMDTHI